MVGDGDGRHLQFFGAADQLLNVAEAIQKRVFSVNVEMDEGHFPLYRW
jgi:hypothetical protein